MAGLGGLSFGLSEEAKQLIHEGVEAVKDLTAEFRRYNAGPPEELAAVGKQVHISPHLADADPIWTTPPGRRVAAFDSGTTVRVPDGMVAVMVPNHLMRVAVDAVLAEQVKR